jgi:DNA-binding protein YbaB
LLSGDQKIKQFSVQGITSQEAIDALNKAIKKSQELAAKKLSAMTGGLGGMLGGGGQ